MNRPPTWKAWMRRLSRPLPAATAVFAAGLMCAVFAIGVNRLVAARPVAPIPVVVPNQGARTTPSPTVAATPSLAQQASCTGADQVTRVQGLALGAPALVSLTDGQNTLDVTVPAGALVNGHATDLHVQATGNGGASQPLHGTLVQAATLCVQYGAQMVRLDVPSGAQVDGSATAATNGAQAQDIHFSVQQQSSD